MLHLSPTADAAAEAAAEERALRLEGGGGREEGVVDRYDVRHRDLKNEQKKRMIQKYTDSEDEKDRKGRRGTEDTNGRGKEEGDNATAVVARQQKSTGGKKKKLSLSELWTHPDFLVNLLISFLSLTPTFG